MDIAKWILLKDHSNWRIFEALSFDTNFVMVFHVIAHISSIYPTVPTAYGKSSIQQPPNFNPAFPSGVQLNVKSNVRRVRNCKPSLFSHFTLYRVAQKECNTINNFKKTRDKMKTLCALLRIKFFSQQDDTKIVNFDYCVLILWPFFLGNAIFKICPSISKVAIYVPKIFHCLAPPGKVSALAL